MAGEPLRFGRPKAAPARGTNRLILGMLTVVVALAVARPWSTASLPEGVPIEVHGEVPRPGLHLVSEPTVARAIAAAGGPESDDQRLLQLGDRVDVTAGEARISSASDLLLVGLPIELNAADAHALSAIPGIGPTLAEKIAADRDARGAFRRLSDVERVDGVGPHTVELLAPFVTVGEVPPVDLQTATAAELETLPGIGPVLAARIVVDRADNGPYRAVEDLLRVPGVGPSLIEQLGSAVTVGAP
jgi:competence protein ComEA